MEKEINEIVNKASERADYFQPDAEVVPVNSVRLLLTQIDQQAREQVIEEMKMDGEAGKLTPFQETVNTYIENRGEEIIKNQDYQS